MTRFLSELVNAGDPLDVYAGAIDLVNDEVAASLRRLPASTLPAWRTLVQGVLAPHQQFVEETLRKLPVDQHNLDAHLDSERIALGLFSRARQALVLECALEALARRLREQGWPEEPQTRALQRAVRS